MSASAHARALLASSPTRLFDFALVNVEQPTRLLRLYESGGAHQVAPDFDAIAALGITPVPGRFVSEAAQVRHDTKKLAQAIVRLIVERGDSAGVPAMRRPANV